MPVVGDIQSQPQQILDLYSQLGGFYNTDPQAQQLQGFNTTPQAQLLQSQIQGRASGADVPYTPGVIQSLLGQSSDAAAGRVASEAGQIRGTYGRAGMGGGALERGALLQSQRLASRQQISGRQDINSRSQLSNFQARAAGQQQLQQLQQQQLQQQQFLAQQRFGAQNIATQGAANFRQRLQEIQSQQAQQQQQQQSQQGLMRQANFLAAQSNFAPGPNVGGIRDTGGRGLAQHQAHQNTARTQLNLLLASGGLEGLSSGGGGISINRPGSSTASGARFGSTPQFDERFA